jgi:hypothetical protein
MIGRLSDTNICSEMFGTSEDESPELDHSEDSENGNASEDLRYRFLY